MTLYAANTSVSVEKSKAEIETLLTRYGASHFMSGWSPTGSVIAFEVAARRVRFSLPLPQKDAARFTHRLHSSGRTISRAQTEAFKLWEQECRSRWRALALVIKAKLEAVESGISSFESEFLAHVMLPNGDTVGEWAAPQLARAYQSSEMPPLMLGPKS
jgi:hypothetical protein